MRWRRRAREVTLAVRNTLAGESAAAEMRSSTGNPSIVVAPLDLTDRASIAAFTAAWRWPLHVLVNSAGVVTQPALTRTPDGWELHFGTDHLGHFELALGLHDALAAAGQSRIVVVSSGGHMLSPSSSTISTLRSACTIRGWPMASPRQPTCCSLWVLALAGTATASPSTRRTPAQSRLLFNVRMAGHLGRSLSDAGRCNSGLPPPYSWRPLRFSRASAVATLKTAMRPSVSRAGRTIFAASHRTRSIPRMPIVCGKPRWICSQTDQAAGLLAVDRLTQVRKSLGRPSIVRLTDELKIWPTRDHIPQPMVDSGRLVVSGGLDGTIRLWEAEGGRSPRSRGMPRGAWRGPERDGQLVASCSDDGMVRRLGGEQWCHTERATRRTAI